MWQVYKHPTSASDFYIFHYLLQSFAKFPNSFFTFLIIILWYGYTVIKKIGVLPLEEQFSESISARIFRDFEFFIFLSKCIKMCVLPTQQLFLTVSLWVLNPGLLCMQNISDTASGLAYRVVPKFLLICFILLLHIVQITFTNPQSVIIHVKMLYRPSAGLKHVGARYRVHFGFPVSKFSATGGGGAC
jgi:hypothetical protein